MAFLTPGRNKYPPPSIFDFIQLTMLAERKLSADQPDTAKWGFLSTFDVLSPATFSSHLELHNPMNIAIKSLGLYQVYFRLMCKNTGSTVRTPEVQIRENSNLVDGTHIIHKNSSQTIYSVFTGLHYYVNTDPTTKLDLRIRIADNNAKIIWLANPIYSIRLVSLH